MDGMGDSRLRLASDGRVSIGPPPGVTGKLCVLWGGLATKADPRLPLLPLLLLKPGMLLNEKFGIGDLPPDMLPNKSGDTGRLPARPVGVAVAEKKGCWKLPSKGADKGPVLL